MNQTILRNICYGINTIIERATKQRSDFLINHVKNLFEEYVCPCYESNNLKGKSIFKFWEGVSKTFNYKFGKLELKTLKEDTVIGPFHFVQKLCNKYIEKFGPDPSIMELYNLSSAMADKVIRRERGW